jgi:hypothetical protein
VGGVLCEFEGVVGKRDAFGEFSFLEPRPPFTPPPVPSTPGLWPRAWPCSVARGPWRGAGCYFSSVRVCVPRRAVACSASHACACVARRQGRPGDPQVPAGPADPTASARCSTRLKGLISIARDCSGVFACRRARDEPLERVPWCRVEQWNTETWGLNTLGVHPVGRVAALRPLPRAREPVCLMQCLLRKGSSPFSRGAGGGESACPFAKVGAS